MSIILSVIALVIADIITLLKMPEGKFFFFLKRFVTWMQIYYLHFYPSMFFNIYANCIDSKQNLKGKNIDGGFA